jgi:Icc-related predicted phosphoesterase
MKIACISDVHGLYHSIQWPKADALVMAGDLCPNFYGDKHRDAQRQGLWLEVKFAPMLKALSNTYRRIYVVPGNHDRVFEFFPKKVVQVLGGIRNVRVLMDKADRFSGVNFYGSPWSSWFHGDHWSFNLPDISDPVNVEARKKVRAIWEQIPTETDVLITHGPAQGYLDKTERGEPVGCPLLAYQVQNRIRPRLHVVGHIHEDAGEIEHQGIKTVNASYVNLRYSPSNPIRVVEI